MIWSQAVWLVSSLFRILLARLGESLVEVDDRNCRLDRLEQTSESEYRRNFEAVIAQELFRELSSLSRPDHIRISFVSTSFHL